MLPGGANLAHLEGDRVNTLIDRMLKIFSL